MSDTAQVELKWTSVSPWFVVDGRLAVIGGSNMTPTEATGANDCDCLVAGAYTRSRQSST